MNFLQRLWTRMTTTVTAAGPRILVVEDDIEVLNLIKDLLETEGYRVETAADGFQGIAKYKKGVYDLVILDHRMPRIGGNEVLETIRSSPGGAAQAVVMLSAENMLGPIGKSYELGIRDWIPKPFTAKTLLTRVRAQLHADKKL